MANDLMPATGFVRTVDPGEPANIEEVKEDINFLHGKFDNDPLLGGHTHDGTAGSGGKLDMNAKHFKLYLVGSDAPIGITRNYLHENIYVPPNVWTYTNYIIFQTPLEWDGMIVKNCLLNWSQTITWASSWEGGERWELNWDFIRTCFEFSVDGATWTAVMKDSSSFPLELSQTGLLQETVFPFYYRFRAGGMTRRTISDSVFRIRTTINLLNCTLEGSIL